MDKIHQFISQTTKSLLVLLAFSFFFSCSNGKIDVNKIDPFDFQTGVSKKEAKNFFFGNKNKKSSNNSEIPVAVDIPKSSQMIAIPTPPKINQQKMISFSVTDQVPLKDVLIELAKVARLDIDLDPEISGGVIINAKNRPLLEVLDRICDMGNLRYSFENNILHIERDSPFTKNYLVDFLADGDLWTQVETNVASIVSNNSSSNDSSTSSSSATSVSSNKPAGIITVFASKKIQTKITRYLEEVKKNSSSQVLIEAKVVEVTLNDNYKTGINWTWTGNGKAKTTLTAGGVNDTNPISIILGNRLFGGDLTTTVSALEQFGTVKAISSPRINVLNNQKATLNFTDKLIYFITDVTSNTSTSASGNTSALSFTSTKNEDSTGTSLGITAAIDKENNEITLNVSPKISVLSKYVQQPYYNPDTGEQLGSNDIPEINTRELATTAKIKSGNILVIGGVMKENSTNDDTGIPFLSKIPVLGYLFKSVTRTSSVVETVIFVKATIINSNNSIDKYDRDLHDKFTSSARPFFKQ